MNSVVLPVVVIPVFNAHEALATCLESLLKNLPAEARVLLADDASTDSRIPNLLLQFKQQAKFVVDIVRREKNIGFPANCNLAFEEAGECDVLLLNSDTIFTRGCLQKIAECAASDSKIATITPWSNNAEICSYPKFCEKNPLPENLDLMAAAAALIEANHSPDLPTAIGFCMWIRRAALKQCGSFDADTFGRGYGGGASFGPLGLTPGGDNLKRLLVRWPDYHEHVARFIMEDPLKGLREQFSAHILAIKSKVPKDDLFGAMD